MEQTHFFMPRPLQCPQSRLCNEQIHRTSRQTVQLTVGGGQAHFGRFFFWHGEQFSAGSEQMHFFNFSLMQVVQLLVGVGGGGQPHFGRFFFRHGEQSTTCVEQMHFTKFLVRQTVHGLLRLFLFYCSPAALPSLQTLCDVIIALAVTVLSQQRL